MISTHHQNPIRRSQPIYSDFPMWSEQPRQSDNLKWIIQVFDCIRPVNGLTRVTQIMIVCEPMVHHRRIYFTSMISNSQLLFYIYMSYPSSAYANGPFRRVTDNVSENKLLQPHCLSKVQVNNSTPKYMNTNIYTNAPFRASLVVTIYETEYVNYDI